MITTFPIPNPIDLHDLASDPTQCWQVDLILAEPTVDAWTSYSGFADPTDPAYSGQQVYATLETLNDTTSELHLDPVLFSGEKYTTSQSVVGHIISAVFSDQTVPVCTETYDVPFVLSPTSSDLNINASFLLIDYPDSINIVW